ncbi:MAG: gamma-glutamyl-gamma-aminobutyrate hydrolase [Rhizobiaceae bacterium MnEN-MB40S]|nr:MAG: gamma-glutamyl-gamma-aminobutyrate hydrolase [Rhizobiaceae bacterium MnEN-MB40S]
MTKPIVALPADVKHADGYDWHASPRQYVDAALKAADVVPLIVPAFGLEEQAAEAIASVLDRVDGVLVTGARSNVYPELYGEPATGANGPYDRARDATSIPLIRGAIERGVPLFAICRGIQELNVALGGTIATEIHEQEGNLDHRRVESDNPDVRFSIRQQINIEAGSCLATILGAEKSSVNSLHRQSIGDLAPGLDVAAVADDGVIEAVSVTNARGFAVGVQWHPEYWATTDATSQQLFKAFGDAVRAYAKSRERALTA